MHRDDLPACAALVVTEGCFPWARERESLLIGAWRVLLDERRMIGVVWEDLAAGSGSRLLGLGITVFVADAFADALAQTPRAYPGVELYESLDSDQPQILSARDIARANAGDGVNLFVLHNPLRERDLAHPANAALLPLGPQAWFTCHAGYNVRSILWEVYGNAHAEYIAGGGFIERGGDRRAAGRRASPQTSRPAAHAPASGDAQDAAGGDDRTPRLFGLARADRPRPAYDAQQLFLFRSPRPSLGYTPAQQRLLAHSMFGLTDREIGVALGLAQNTIKRLWRDIFERTSAFVPALFDESGEGNGHTRERPDARGTQKRHLLINFMRQNMHELRPYEPVRPAARASADAAARRTPARPAPKP